jgi:hypothetical protein
MNIPGEGVEFCPVRTNPHWSQTHYDRVQFADFNYVQVAQYGEVQYFQPSDSEDDNAPEVDADDNGDGEFLASTAKESSLTDGSRC